MNALIRIKNAAPVFVIALSLVTATATTTDVIFSFEEDEGEYADTDLETDSAGNIYGTTVLGGEFGGGTVFQLSPTPTGWEHAVLYSFTGGADGGEPYKGVTSIGAATCTARRLRAVQVVVKAVAEWSTSSPSPAGLGTKQSFMRSPAATMALARAQGSR